MGNILQRQNEEIERQKQAYEQENNEVAKLEAVLKQNGQTLDGIRITLVNGEEKETSEVLETLRKNTDYGTEPTSEGLFFTGSGFVVNKLGGGFQFRRL